MLLCSLSLTHSVSLPVTGLTAPNNVTDLLLRTVSLSPLDESHSAGVQLFNCSIHTFVLYCSGNTSVPLLPPMITL
jgi:hypothetical protein